MQTKKKKKATSFYYSYFIRKMTKAILAGCQLITYCPICETELDAYIHDCCNPPNSDTYMNFQQVENLVKTNKLPIQVTLSHYYDTVVIGSVRNWVNDRQALTATILLDDEQFVNAIVEISTLYFGQRNLPNNPLLYLRKIFPGFSLCHNKNNLIVDHVAVVCVPKRHGSIAEYEWTEQFSVRSSEFKNADIKAIILAVTSDGLTITDRPDLLKRNLKFSQNPIDNDFVYAGFMPRGQNNELLETQIHARSKISSINTAMDKVKKQLLIDLLSNVLLKQSDGRANTESTLNDMRKRSNEDSKSDDDPMVKQIKMVISEQQGIKTDILELKEMLKQHQLQPAPSDEQQHQKPQTISPKSETDA